MIVRPQLVMIPHAVLADRRLSADTRAMLAFIFAKQRGWRIRRAVLMTALSHEREPLGRTRIDRMLREAIQAGYLRRGEWTRGPGGRVTGLEYTVSLPDGAPWPTSS